jgi:hypothetical protein
MDQIRLGSQLTPKDCSVALLTAEGLKQRQLDRRRSWRRSVIVEACATKVEHALPHRAFARAQSA